MPHPCIGAARRLMVPRGAAQHEVLVEAVQNHTPEVLVVDEIGTCEVGAGDVCKGWVCLWMLGLVLPGAL